jgi:hypothetical protein
MLGIAAPFSLAGCPTTLATAGRSGCTGEMFRGHQLFAYGAGLLHAGSVGNGLCVSTNYFAPSRRDARNTLISLGILHRKKVENNR